MMTRTKNQDQAIDRYATHLDTIKALTTRIHDHAEVGFGKGPWEINWGHVGTAQDVAKKLQEISDMLFGEGEYAR